MTYRDQSEKIIIVGAGCCGLATALSLLEQGYQDVHIFDKRDYLTKKYSYFDGCDSPSSDMNKIFRASYGEETHYQRMATASREKMLMWNEMIRKEGFEGGEPLYFNTGNIHLTDQDELPLFEQSTIKWMGPKKAICISESDALERAVSAGIDPCAIDPFAAKERGVHLQGVLDTAGGTIMADKACRWVLNLCQRAGGPHFTTHFGPELGEVDHILEEYNEATGRKKCVGIKTKDEKLHFASTTICACGPWLSEVVPETQERVEATAGTVALMRITDPKALAKYDQRSFPTWTYKMRDGAIGGLYGFPVRNGYLKIGFRGLKWTNPQPGINSKIKTKWSEPSETNVPVFGLNMIKKFVRDNIPEVQKIDLTRMCWYGDSEDNDFLISYSPYHEKDSLFVIGGDSGHAFMMIGSIGSVITDIINNCGDKFLMNLFSWERKRDRKNVINMGNADPRALQNQKMATPRDWYIYGEPKL
ncbi:DEKNAAC104491 [Brettanomyces naardenensis]|uniref:DEKNAAC104491 n=1 Tax=Brettanomyces naardenensis TaxID=13370 RepID=A0A448YRP7_BRENA|nr:DEKNAAC104491 [Brettanomyces naardenensis]